MQISKQTIQCEKKTSSFHWFDFISKHLDLCTFVVTKEISQITCTHAFWRYFFASEIEVWDIFFENSMSSDEN